MLEPLGSNSPAHVHSGASVNVKRDAQFNTESTMGDESHHLDYATPPGDPGFTRVYKAADPMDAEFVRGLLENAGLTAVVHGANVSSWYGPILGQAVAPGVYVPQADLAAAEKIVARYVAGEIEIGEPWTCPQCGELIEGQFTACWNCGATPDWDGEATPAIPLDGDALDYRREDLPDDIDDVREETEPNP